MSDVANNNIGVAVKDWYDEVQFYDLFTNTCKEKEVCGHYTQVGKPHHFCQYIAVVHRQGKTRLCKK